MALPIIIPTKIRATPIHCNRLTSSDNTNADMITATGSSEAVSIVPSPGPTCGIPIEKNNGGKMTPNIPRIKP